MTIILALYDEIDLFTKSAIKIASKSIKQSFYSRQIIYGGSDIGAPISIFDMKVKK